ncbi:hypothetical protein DMN91_010710 [Ooceraea biroi]|uniref:PWWP domain-containing protein n=1 Tax=Ooceraea biroi TaxID=2015173 RepID=A0A026WW24_OOCBI|nr:titin homolog [Ooceraea biroi]EZA60207.1 hypothetical protein X777_13295 [Ooceraea biroi]RLU16642.1 hypothetical protein DMN91_010710 [Ooceraea biroi]
MCEQTEINYLDGDVVWVKLGACWWPGQVTGLRNLPEDIQAEFQKKPLIAAVKFFQEDTYEFVKNYQQIYKYTCTLKDEFIKKGLDKYRSKSKDGSSYMDKFPGDVEMAEKLTGGDPDILAQEKFSPEEKPDIAALFGEKRIPKKKREDGHRRSDGAESMKKITHPRFLRESDHEVRIRQQPGSLPSTPTSTGRSPVYRCHVCSFTSTRVNVIICHQKSHRSGDTTPSKVKTYSQSRSRVSDTSTPKRKYVRKEKSQSSKKKSESGLELGKRKHFKQNERSVKKKKTDPELREKLLADWDDESDEEMSVSVTNSLNNDLSSPSVKNQSNLDNSKEDKEENAVENNEIMAETEKLLKETEELSSIQILRESLDNLHSLKNVRLSSFEKKSESEKSEKGVKTDTSNESFKKSQKKDTSGSDSETKNVSDKDDKKSRLSCFDFDEDDLSEPSIPPVRKIPRVFGEKNLSLKKEIIKEFEMSQALKNEIKKEAEITSKISKHMELKADEIMEIIQGSDHRQEKKEIGMSEKLDKNVRDKTEAKKSENKEEKQTVPSEGNQQKSPKIKSPRRERKIVETVKVVKEDGDNDRSSNSKMDTEKRTKTIVPDASAKNKIGTEGKGEILARTKSDDKLFQLEKIDSEDVIAESNDNTSMKEADDTLSERFTTETEDETVSESAETMPEQSENSDVDMLDQSGNLSGNREVLVKRGRGRPRKNKNIRASVDKSSKVKANRGNKRLRVSEKIEIERKTSDSDTDRSYSGRRRKPNKKYLESDIYVPDSEYRAFRTDESQSESETKASEKTASKSRRNKRFKGVENKSSEVVAQMHEQEIEVSDRTPTVSENNVNASLIEAKHESNVSKQEISFGGLEEKSEEMKRDVSAKSTKPLNKTSIGKVDTDVSLEEVQMSGAKNKTEGAKLDLAKSVEKPSEVKEKEDLSKQDKDIEQDQKKPHIEQMADTADKVEAQPEIAKTNVDMLPPKKSQIKKFELSQIDFFDVHANKTVETESESERKIAPESKIEPGRGRKVGFQTDFEEKIDEGNKGEVKTPSTMTDEVEKSTTDTEKQKNLKSFELQEKPDKVDVKEQKKQSVEKISQKIENEKNQLELKSPEKKIEIKSPSKSDGAPKSPTKTIVEQQLTPKKSSMQTRYKGRFTPETGKGRKDRDLFTEEKPANTFQEAFLKTLQIDKKKVVIENADGCKGKKEKKTSKKKTETDMSTAAQDTKIDEPNKNLGVSGDVQIEGNIQKIRDIQAEGNTSNISVVSNFENVEIVVEEKIKHDIKTGDSIFESSPSEFVITSKPLELGTSSEDNSTVDLATKLDETPKTSTPTASLSTEISVPVKKREMPRIIENVTLTEPVQILKTKLLDKLPQKNTKHKLDHADIAKGSPKTKIMKIETLPSNSRVKGAKSSPASPHLSLTKKLQILKTEEADALASANTEKITPTKQTIVATPITEKFIQQSSQSLADIELDINSMPFVLSEDVLTPESIEQMPVVISSIIPASSSIPATLSFTPTTQIVSPTKTQFKITSETAVATETSPAKKKSGVPAILKNKSKARPTITSVKTLVPPLTGGVKGLKFQSTQPVSKTPPLLTQKSATPGKYVVVQTADGQQLRYSVQGKSGTQQKIAISTGKTAGNAQVIQQGGKVVILTSGQSCQTKMVPLNISKTLSGKVQRIVTSKGQLLCPISPQGGIITSKIIAPKADTAVAAAAAAAGSPTTSKLATSGHKIINTQGIITSKGVLTPIPGTIAKTALLGTLSQGILTKDGIYTPISASALSGKIIGSKTLVTKSGTTLLSPQAQNLGGTKAILTPVSQAITGKTILGTQAIVSSKGTILTPITGQQVKAIAAKSPVKGSKVQYQQVQQKVQLPILQKSPKVPISVASSQARVPAKSPSGTLILQNTTATGGTVVTQKGMHGKKIIKQVVQSGAAIQGIASPSGTQQTMTVVQQVQQMQPKAKTATVQKVIIPRTGSRQTKAQQKILVQKVQEPAVSTVQGIHTKQTIVATTANVPIAAKTAVHSKQVATPVTPKSSAKSSGKTGQIQNTLLNVALNSISTATTSGNIVTTVALPPLEPIDAEKKKKKTDVQVTDTVPKEQGKTEKFQAAEKSNDAEKTAEEPKIAAQPQIMALPTESSDGTQTYVLVTIDEQGQIQPLDNNALMSLEGTTQNPDGTRTLYIDPSSLGEAGTLDNIVLQFDNGILPGIQTNVTEASQTTITESFPASEVIQTSNQDILAAALANTDFQQEINLPENQTGSVMTQTGLTQTSLINQTILQSTIIPPTEPISSPSVLETSLTLNQPIMTPLEVPSNLPIQSADSTPTSVVSTIPSSLELPITITNPNISYISTAGETQIQIPGNSMPDIGEIIESPATATATATAVVAAIASGEIDRAEIPVSTQYLVIPNLDNIAAAEDARNVPNAEASYTVTMPNSIVLESSQQVQTTPSMPIIDDTYADNSQFTTTIVAAEQTFADVPVSEMLVSKAVSVENVQSQDVTVTSEMIVSSRQVPVASPQKVQTISTDESTILDEERVATTQEVYSSQEVPITSEELISSQSVKEVSSAMEVTREKSLEDDCKKNDTPTMTGLPMIDDTTLVTSESNSRVESMEQASFEVTDSSEPKAAESHQVDTIDKLKQLSFAEGSSSKINLADQQIAGTSNQADVQVPQPVESLNSSRDAAMEVDEAPESELYAGSTTGKHDSRHEDCQRDEPSSQEESDRRRLRQSMELRFEEEEEARNADASQETPSQSRYEQFIVSISTNVVDLPSQSAAKLESSSGEATQSVTYEPMETDEEAAVTEPPTQSFEHSKINEASQSYEASAEANVNAPTQSFNEIVQRTADEPSADEAIDDQSFPTQSYEVDKGEGMTENLETDAEISQEGNIPSQSNDIGADGIGTSSVSTNNSGLNEDETASSSYVPETPENQERDQDQESAISTSSYEIPPCEELNIASSSVIPDTSVSADERIHDNGVPEIPTSSSYNLNPDITSTHHVDSAPSSSYEDQVIVEQNVSTSYEVPIPSMPGLEETCSQNFVTESTDHHRNEPSSYYASHHQEVTASYYESVDQDSANSRLEEDPHEEHVTPGGYYEGNPQEVSQSYFAPAEETPNYTSHGISPSYYDPSRPESEASQSYYSAEDLDGKTEEQSSSSPNIEASQSFYQERSGELRLRQQGEATPTYTEGYPVDYTLENSPIERHDLVESSVPATRPMDR